MRDELAMLSPVFYAVKMPADRRHATRIANGYDGICQLFRMQVEVIDRAFWSNDEFGGGDGHGVAGMLECWSVGVWMKLDNVGWSWMKLDISSPIKGRHFDRREKSPEVL